ncbi:MAG: HDIG domain-containing protein [Phycisphaerales bacterium]|nr:HDIG domain-containing protein [Phycisphaerales bacterium]
MGERTQATSTRRAGLRQRIAAGDAPPMWERLLKPELAPVLLIALGFLAAMSVVMASVRGVELIAVGRVMDETRTVRREFRMTDEVRTNEARALARGREPWVFLADQSVFEPVVRDLERLPASLAPASDFEQVLPAIRQAFDLTPELFAAVKTIPGEGPAAEEWQARIAAFARLLSGNPVLTADEYQTAVGAASRLELRSSPTTPGEVVPVERALSAGVPEAGERVRELARQAGLSGPLAEVAAKRVLGPGGAMYRWSRELTEKRQADAAAGVPASKVTHRPGEVIFQRGDRLSETQHILAHRENDEFLHGQEWSARLSQWLGIVGLVGVAALGIGGYLKLFYRQVFDSPLRLGAVGAIMTGALAASAWGGAKFPEALWAATLGPVVFVAMIMAIAYDRRLALLVAVSQAILTGIALSLSVGFVAAAVVGVVATAWKLEEVRHRNDMLRGGLVVSAALTLSVFVVSLLERPRVDGVLLESAVNALAGGIAGFAAAAVVLVLLPYVERIFDVTTGMTLSELRDPRHPLLRKLQQRAPGTFNHSHTVATIAESAAEAIGCNGLHVYVGALYHDIGKMNKPDYFVENQAGGFNRHDKLSPAMSLLVIVGHVKDGVELAKEYGLPRSLHHYIESHHGTTLVEYFYDRARREALGEGEEAPEEVEYRYPGPRPRTKEAAILMICDAVESATRAMGEPTPARIAALVRDIAARRLADGQFDECDLTLRQLQAIEDAITKALNSIYHGRIAYPREEREDRDEREPARAAGE